MRTLVGNDPYDYRDKGDNFGIAGYEFRLPHKYSLDKLRLWMGGLIAELFDDQKINQHGLDFLDRAFRNDQTHEAGQYLLINAIQDGRFVDKSKVWGTDLVAHVVVQDKA